MRRENRFTDIAEFSGRQRSDDRFRARRRDQRRQRDRYSKTKSNQTPWYTEFDKMAMKTALRRLIGTYGPMSNEMQMALTYDAESDAEPDKPARQTGPKEKENMKKEITWADVSLFLTKEITDHEETISFMDREDERNRLSIKVLREKNDELKARIKELEQSDANL